MFTTKSIPPCKVMKWASQNINLAFTESFDIKRCLFSCEKSPWVKRPPTQTILVAGSRKGANVLQDIFYFPPLYEVYMGMENHALRRVFLQFLPLLWLTRGCPAIMVQRQSVRLGPDSGITYIRFGYNVTRFGYKVFRIQRFSSYFSQVTLFSLVNQKFQASDDNYLRALNNNLFFSKNYTDITYTES